MANDLRTLANLSRDGYIHNVAHSDILDLYRSYWYGDAMKDVQFVKGGMYLLIGDYFTDALQSCHCLYQNKSILNNVYGSENHITDMVFDGKWTYDAMIRVIEDTAQDLNGDGELTQGDDLFGFTCWGKWGSMVPFVIGTGIKFIECTDDGPRFCFNNERSVKILEKLNELFYANGAHSDLTNPSMQTLQGIFTNGMTTLLGYNRLGSMADFREVEFGMGPLPYPKLDETQTDYVSSLHDTTEVGAIPMTVPPENLDFCQTVLEVACRETGRSVIPEWYENGLKIKYSAGQDDAKMIDLIHDSITDPFPIAYDSGMAGFMISLCFGAPLNNQSTDFASAYAQNVGAAEIAVQTAYDKFRENLENGN